MVSSSELRILVDQTTKIGDAWITSYKYVQPPSQAHTGLAVHDQLVRVSDGSRWDVVAFVSSRPAKGLLPVRQATLRAVDDGAQVLRDGDVLGWYSSEESK